MILVNIWKHLKKICTHKYWVGYYCFKVGLYWQGITHDLSKFNPIEFFESVKYYQGTRSPLAACKEENGYSKAWLHHRGRNLHHYQCWCDDFDDYYSEKGLTLIKMPYKYVAEMVCDYLGAARAYLGKDFSYKKEWEWWLGKRDNCAMHPQTKFFVDDVLYALASCQDDKTSEKLFSEEFLKSMYNKERTAFWPDLADLRAEC